MREERESCRKKREKKRERKYGVFKRKLEIKMEGGKVEIKGK